MTDRDITTGVLFNTLDPGQAVPRDFNGELAVESLVWQGASQSGDRIVFPAMMAALSREGRGSRKLDAEGIERLAEILGLMGAIGEQAMLARACLQDMQRAAQTDSERRELENRVLLRAWSEMAAHYILGAAHSIANLVLRTVLLSEEAARTLLGMRAYADRSFLPNQDNRTSWLTFTHSMAEHLRQAARAAGNAPLVSITEALFKFHESPEFQALDDRRGQDYHRRRPQSVPHTSNPAGLAKKTESGIAYAIGLPKEDPEANADLVHRTVVDAAPGLIAMMRTYAEKMGDALRAEGLVFFDFDVKWTEQRVRDLESVAAHQAQIDTDSDDQVVGSTGS